MYNLVTLLSCRCILLALFLVWVGCGQKEVPISVGIVSTDNMISRLRDVADIEQMIAVSLTNNASDLFGLKLDELAENHRELLALLTKKQSKATSDIGKLKLELEEHLKSDQNQNQEQEMILGYINGSNIILAFEKTQEDLSRGNTFHAMNSSLAWSERLREWADLLEK